MYQKERNQGGNAREEEREEVTAERQLRLSRPLLSIRTVDFRVKGRGKHTAEIAEGRQSRKGRGRRPSVWWEGGYGGCSRDSGSYTMKLFASLAHE